MKVLITGAAGFLGSHIGIKLSKLGYDVYGVDNMIGGDDYNWSWLTKEKSFKYDCSNLEQMLLVTKGMDIVYHYGNVIFFITYVTKLLFINLKINLRLNSLLYL